MGASQRLSGGVMLSWFDIISRYVLTLDIARKRHIEGINGDGDGCADGEQL